VATICQLASRVLSGLGAASAHRECAQWNRAVSAARGELVWFLRGGATPSAELFIELSTRAGVGPTTCGSNGEPCNPGDIAGMMLQRADVLLVGPLSETIINTPVALEDYSMRLGSKLPPVVLVAGDSRCPTAVAEDPASLVLETEQLVNRWAPLESDARAAAPNHAALGVSESAEVSWAGRGQFAKVIKR
jgi:hypothetical protein